MSDRKTVDVEVTIPTDLSHTGQERKATKPIDVGVADIVAALEAAGIRMRGSCSGHQLTAGEINLEDGRLLLVVPPHIKHVDLRLVVTEQCKRHVWWEGNEHD